MASIQTETLIDAPVEDVWDALRDWGAMHERLVPGFAVDARLEGGDRIVTFFNGATARERLVHCDDDARRIVWTIVEGAYTHHNGVAQVFPDGAGRTRFVWTADLLPDALEEPTRAMMARGTEVIRQTLQAGGGAPS